MELKSIFKQATLYTIGNVANRITGFLMIPVYTHFLTPSDYGVIELTELFITVSVVSFGVQSVGGSMIRIYHDFDDPERRKRVVMTALTGVLAMSLVIVLAGYAASPLLSRLLNDSQEFRWFIVLAFVAMFFGNFVQVCLVYERIRQRALFFVGFSLVQLAFLLAFNVYFIVFRGLGVWGFLLSKLIVMAAGAAFMGWRVVREVGFGFDRAIAGRILHFGAPLIASGLAFFAIHFSDRFFLNHYANLHDVGIYSLAYRFAFLVTLLVGEPFARVWNVSLYEYAKNEGWERHFGRVLAYLILALVVTGTGISIFIEDVIRLMAAPEFQGAAAVVPILVLAYAIREIGDFFRNVLYINKRSGLVGKIAVLSAAANLLLNYLLIPPFGVYGAALATLITWAIYSYICWVFQHREFRIPVPIRPLVTLAVLAGAFYAARVWLSPGPWYQAWGLDALLGGALIAAIWLSGTLPPQEKADLLRYLRRTIRGRTGPPGTDARH